MLGGFCLGSVTQVSKLYDLVTLDHNIFFIKCITLNIIGSSKLSYQFFISFVFLFFFFLCYCDLNRIIRLIWFVDSKKCLSLSLSLLQDQVVLGRERVCARVCVCVWGKDIYNADAASQEDMERKKITEKVIKRKMAFDLFLPTDM